jgi:hypothetical protein
MLYVERSDTTKDDQTLANINTPERAGPTITLVDSLHVAGKTPATEDCSQGPRDMISRLKYAHKFQVARARVDSYNSRDGLVLAYQLSQMAVGELTPP